MSGEGKRLRKRLFCNLDGTGQAEYTLKAAVKPDGTETSPAVSNVARIGRATLMDDEKNGFEQVVYYQTGLYADAEKATDPLQGTHGVGLTSNVREAYGFICNNYDYGDEIYITGFSRGAFTARSVAGLIGRCGILTKYGLNYFYEALQYYKNYKNLPPDKKKNCPVTPEKGTTRILDPETGEKIKIKAVGVWDTVGALDSRIVNTGWQFHDLSLGDHIENAYHIMALNEHRAYFNCTLWESALTKRAPENFEQCWMAGDHTNIGGSWPEQQLSDITLAWMMSRFEDLGVKFDQTYLYREYEKVKDYVKNVGPGLTGEAYQGDGPAYDPTLSPRQWGEGRTHNIWYETADIPIVNPLSVFSHSMTWPKREALHGGWIDRQVGLYKAPELTGKDERYLRNTNETFHPAIRYRRFCNKHDKLGYKEQEGYEPGQLKTWKYPRAQKDGRIGLVPAADDPATFKYEFTRDGINKDPKETVPYTESVMKNLELVYLAFYDQDPDFSGPNSGIWQKVMGGTTGPPQEIKDQVTNIIAAVKKGPPSQAFKGSSQPKPDDIYKGRKPALADDSKLFATYAPQANTFQVGSWNGESGSTADASKKDFTYAAFNSLDRLKADVNIQMVEVMVNLNAAAIGRLRTFYSDGAQTIFAGRASVDGTRSAISVGSDNAKIIKVETKAAAAKDGNSLVKIVGLRLETDKGIVMSKPNQYDSITDAQTVSESAPAGGWELKGWYGAETATYLVRLGPIWGKRT